MDNDNLIKKIPVMDGRKNVKWFIISGRWIILIRNYGYPGFYAVKVNVQSFNCIARGSCALCKSLSKRTDFHGCAFVLIPYFNQRMHWSEKSILEQIDVY